MGAVDLVLQVESPKSVTAGLQRIGRAGHNVGDTSKGRIFPKFRADLLECAVVAQRMREGKIETTVVPRNPLDVLAQQIVAMAATAEDEPLAVDLLAAMLARTYTYAELSRAQLENVLDMLDGRYPSEEFGELRPRIVWDRVNGHDPRPQGLARAGDHERRHDPRPRPVLASTCRTAAASASSTRRWSTRRAPARCSCSARRRWRIEEITRDRVIVTPAPGVPGAVPFWKGDGLGPAAGARRGDRRVRPLGGRAGPGDAGATSYDLDAEGGRRTCVEFLREQQEATRVIPSDRTIVIERFRDEIGDWRVCVLSPVRRPRARRLGPRAVSARIREVYGLESDAIWSDDGIIVHLPDADEAPGRGADADRAGRARGPGRRRAGRVARCSAPASARTPAARC